MRNDQRDEQTYPYPASDAPAEHGIPAPRSGDDAWAPPADPDDSVQEPGHREPPADEADVGARTDDDRTDDDRADEENRLAHDTATEDAADDEGTAAEDRLADDTTAEGTAAEDRLADDTTADTIVEDTRADDTRAEDTAADDTATEDTADADADTAAEEPVADAGFDRPVDGERPDEPMVTDAQVTDTDDVQATGSPADEREAVDEPAVGVASVEPVAVGVAAAVPVDEEDRADAQPADEPPAELKPGEADALPDTTVWDDAAVEQLRTRWHEVQLRFIDDPRGAAEQAESLVAEAVDSLTAALAATRQELGAWRSEESGDTEHFRVAVRQYRDFLDRILGR